MLESNQTSKNNKNKVVQRTIKSKTVKNSAHKIKNNIKQNCEK